MAQLSAPPELLGDHTKQDLEGCYVSCDRCGCLGFREYEYLKDGIARVICFDSFSHGELDSYVRFIYKGEHLDDSQRLVNKAGRYYGQCLTHEVFTGKDYCFECQKIIMGYVKTFYDISRLNQQIFILGKEIKNVKRTENDRTNEGTSRQGSRRRYERDYEHRVCECSSQSCEEHF